MKDVMQLLVEKEQELLKVKRQVEALRIALPLLNGEEETRVPAATSAVAAASWADTLLARENAG